MAAQREKSRFAIGLLGASLCSKYSVGGLPDAGRNPSTIMPISDEKIRGLETQNANIRERLAKVEGILEANSKNEQKSKPHQLIFPALFTLIFGALIGLYGLLYTQGTKITAILTVLQPQTALKNTAAAVSMEPRQAKKELAQVASTF